jgi:RimJ/RimL family protein N-acetyltransferase
MRHSLTAQGYGLRLRPVRLDDAPFIVWLRNLDFVKGRVGDSAADVPGQERWLNRYFEREGDYYFIAETLNEISLGTYGIYDLNETSAEIGRLVIRPEVPAGTPATLLLIDLFYEQMGITHLRGRAVAGNHRARSLFRRLGFNEVKVEHAAQVIGGRAVDMVLVSQVTEDWLRVREILITEAQQAETWIREWAQAYLKCGSQGLVAEI